MINVLKINYGLIPVTYNSSVPIGGASCLGPEGGGIILLYYKHTFVLTKALVSKYEVLSQIASHRRPDGGPTSGAAGATVGPTAAATVVPTLGWPSALGRPDVGPTAASRRWPDGGPTAACRSYIFIECAWLLYDLIIQITTFFKIFEYQGI